MYIRIYVLAWCSEAVIERGANNFIAAYSIAKLEKNTEILTVLRPCLSREVNQKLDHRNTTCLMISCYNGDMFMAENLLELGANVHDLDTNECDALYHASFRGQADMVRFLISHGATRFAKALAIATELGHSNVVDIIAPFVSVSSQK